MVLLSEIEDRNRSIKEGIHKMILSQDFDDLKGFLCTLSYIGFNNLATQKILCEFQECLDFIEATIDDPMAHMDVLTRISVLIDILF